MALSDRIAQFLPGCISRGGPAVTTPTPGNLAIAGVDQLDGTGAILVQQTSASSIAFLPNAALQILDKGGVNKASVDANGALLVEVTASQTPLLGSSSGAGAASNAASLASTAGLITYISGFEITAAASTAVVGGGVSVIGPATPLAYYFVDSAVNGGQLIVTYPDPIPASAANVPVTVSLAAITGGGPTAINVHGFQR